MERLTPTRIIAYGVIGAMALFGVHEFVGYEASRAGDIAGEHAKDKIEDINIADEQWARLQELLQDEDLKQLLVDNLREDGIEDPMDILDALQQGD